MGRVQPPRLSIVVEMVREGGRLPAGRKASTEF